MLSARLKMVADYVNICNVAADIGTDHGYIPIWLVKNNICKRAIAADISKGSCNKAQNNINISRLEDKISVRCGSGLEVIDSSEDNVDCIIISGMGGLMTVSVLKSSAEAVNNASQLVLQPQRDINAVRKYVTDNGFKIIDESILKDNNKFYIAINCVKGRSEKYNEAELYFGKYIAKNNTDIFKEYIDIEINKIYNALLSIKENLSDDNKKRYDELANKYNMYKEVGKCL